MSGRGSFHFLLALLVYICTCMNCSEEISKIYTTVSVIVIKINNNRVTYEFVYDQKILVIVFFCFFAVVTKWIDKSFKLDKRKTTENYAFTTQKYNTDDVVHVDNVVAAIHTVRVVQHKILKILYQILIPASYELLYCIKCVRHWNSLALPVNVLFLWVP